jgi:hypothetical protein
MTRSSFPILVTALVIVVSGTAAGAAAKKKPQPLVMTMSSHVAPAESDVIVRARVEPDARSRELIIEWVGDDLSGGSHAIMLDGERAVAMHQFSIKRMGAGHYVVNAILRFDDGSEIRRASKVMIVGVGGPDQIGRGAYRSRTMR